MVYATRFTRCFTARLGFMPTLAVSFSLDILKPRGLARFFPIEKGKENNDLEVGMKIYLYTTHCQPHLYLGTPNARDYGSHARDRPGLYRVFYLYKAVRTCYLRYAADCFVISIG